MSYHLYQSVNLKKGPFNLLSTFLILQGIFLIFWWLDPDFYRGELNDICKDHNLQHLKLNKHKENPRKQMEIVLYYEKLDNNILWLSNNDKLV